MNQIRSRGHETDEIPLQFSKGKSIHGIRLEDSSLTLPFRMDGCISYLPIRTPNEWELKDCPKIWLNDSVRTWDPQSDLLAQQESTYSVNQGRKVATVALFAVMRSRHPSTIRRLRLIVILSTQRLGGCTMKRRLESRESRESRPTFVGWTSIQRNCNADLGE